MLDRHHATVRGQGGPTLGCDIGTHIGGTIVHPTIRTATRARPRGAADRPHTEHHRTRRIRAPLAGAPRLPGTPYECEERHEPSPAGKGNLQ
ncbi:hypothetical protein [Natronoglycomyces albus]|uniref:Uncharacterized protein n=1 Tax=Natronoglycomyces albus TaxID=2811108 RepID=A0A895XT06_9ACTN|nr:hypothetical protein [Natronoglycomyces albus]QSB06395.1 hypothetical protein JQS30_05670 [Natronoglycomyces albus]